MATISDADRCQQGLWLLGIYLLMVQLGVQTGPREQLVVGARLDNPSALENYNAIGHANGRQAMRDDEAGAAHEERQESALDERFVGRVECARGFVQNQNARVAQNDPRNRQALALAPRERVPPFADDGLVALRERHDGFVNLGCSRSALDLVKSCIGLGVPKIIEDRSVKEKRLLGHDADVRAQRLELDGAKIAPIE